jgi:lysophospholipid hydrolase
MSSTVHPTSRETCYSTYPNQYGTLQFGRYDEIYQVGYSAAVEMLDQWDAEHRLPSRFVTNGDEHGLGSKTGKKSKGRSLRRNSI